MIVIEPPSSGTGDPGAFALLRKPALARFVLRAKRAVGISGDITVLLCDNVRIRELNRSFRGKNKATDVLSFPAGENAEGAVGDLAISVEIAVEQAAEQNHTLEEELRILLLHGVLHLAGYDHEVDAGEMRAKETDLRAKLKLPAGLIERTLGRKPAKKRATTAGKELVAGGSTR